MIDHGLKRQASGLEIVSAELLKNLEKLRVAEAELGQQNKELECGQAMLEYAQWRYKELFEFALDAYVVIDGAGTIREINAAAEGLLGVPANYAEGKSFAVFVPSLSRAAFRRLLDDTVKQDCAVEDDFDLLLRDGKTIPVSVRIIRSQPEVGESAGLLWIIRDISSQIAIKQRLRTVNQELEQRVVARTTELEQVLQHESNANRGKVEFLKLLSHEIRTPLHALMAYTELLEHGIRGPITELQSKDLRGMQQGHRHILGLVNRILEFAQVEGGHVTLDSKEVEIQPLIRVVLDILQPKCAEKGIECRFSMSEEIVAVRGDTEAIRQILINLIGNAIKFNVSQGVVEIYWESVNDEIGIHVKDTGVGIAPNDIDFVFLSFTQVLNNRSDSCGTGLGLPISRALAQSMEGRLEVQSVLGSGSTFSLWLTKFCNGASVAPDNLL